MHTKIIWGHRLMIIAVITSVTVLTCMEVQAQNVLIGTPITNSAKLHVLGTHDYGNTVHALRISGNNPFLDFSDAQGQVNYGFFRSRNNNTTGGFPLGLEIGVTPPEQGQPERSISFSTYYTPRMTISYDGNVGIGTISPTQPLTIKSTIVAANDNTNIMRLEGRNPVVSFWNGSGVGAGFIKAWTDAPNSGFAKGMIIGAVPGENVYLSTNYGPTMVVHNNGNVGIGTSSPSAKFHINANNEAIRIGGTSPFITLYNGAEYRGYLLQKGAADIELSTTWMNESGSLTLGIKSVPKITIGANGRVKIGSVADVTKWPVAYDQGVPIVIDRGLFIKQSIDPFDEWMLRPAPFGVFYFSKNNQEIARIESDGDWYAVSDRRLKNSLNPYSDVLEKVKQLQVVSYKLNSEPNLSHKTLGLIAQEVAAHFPEIAHVNKETGYYAMAYAKIGVIAIKAIQEQQAIIDDLQKLIDELRNMVLSHSAGRSQNIK